MRVTLYIALLGLVAICGCERSSGDFEQGEAEQFAGMLRTFLNSASQRDTMTAEMLVQKETIRVMIEYPYAKKCLPLVGDMIDILSNPLKHEFHLPVLELLFEIASYVALPDKIVEPVGKFTKSADEQMRTFATTILELQSEQKSPSNADLLQLQNSQPKDETHKVKLPPEKSPGCDSN